MKLIKIDIEEETPRWLNREEIVDRLLILTAYIDLEKDIHISTFKEKMELLFNFPFVKNPSSILDHNNLQSFNKLKRTMIG